MHKRITYTCKKCGWKGSIIEAWSDLKPRRCPIARCKTNFKKEPHMLLIELPKPESEPTLEEISKEIDKDAGDALKSEGVSKHGRKEATLSKRV